MADGFETYHVPQQSRRDKLRILPQNHDHNNFQPPPPPPPPPPFYDPSSLLFHSDFIASCPSKVINLVKEEGLNFMGSYLPLNPSSNTTNTTNNTPTTYPFVYAPNNLQVLRDFDDHVVFRPEPLCLELNLQRYGGGSGSNVLYNDQNMVSSTSYFGGSSSITGSDFIPKELSRSNYAVPLGPFTGYATILKRSRFLKPAQQLLEEFCYVGIRPINNDDGNDDSDGTLSFIESSTDHTIVDDSNHDMGGESGRKKSRLNSMLEEVCRKYRQYYQQIQEVIASFECVAGLGNAAPYANLALKTLSKHFRSLKNAITEHLQFTIKAHREMGPGKDTITRSRNTDRGIFCQRPMHNPGFIEHQPVWRPQRGLPERAVTVLRAWLFEHFLHPYPTDTDKLMLAKQTGLSRSQVSNWFINARVRLWKPMVEEIHMLETRQAQKASQERNSDSRPSHQEPISSSVAASNPSPSTQRAGQDILSKRIRNELTGLPLGNETQPNMSYDNLASNPLPGIGVSTASRSSSVSLTLGLHQNNGVGLSEQFNQAQQFGLNPGANAEGYAMNGFEAQHRPFGRDVIGGQLLHDFVG